MSIRCLALSLAVLVLFAMPDFSRRLHSQAAQKSGPTTEVKEAGVRQLIRNYVAARKTADPTKLQALFTPDADQLVSTGEWRRGRVDVVKGTMESSRREKGDRSIEVESIRFIQDDVALADARYDLTGTQVTPRHMRTALLCQRTNGIWKIAAIRNMLPAA